MRANIGDDLLTLRGRYGSAQTVGNQVIFSHAGFSITVAFDSDKAGMEIFTRDNSIPSKTDFTMEDVDALLKLESDGGTWDPAPSEPGKMLWVRSDKKLVARFIEGEKPEDKYLTIMLNQK